MRPLPPGAAVRRKRDGSAPCIVPGVLTCCTRAWWCQRGRPRVFSQRRGAGHFDSPSLPERTIVLGFSKFVTEKLRVADALAKGGCGGDYIDAVMIMAALISGIASDVWPGTGNDKRRFVELWIEYSGPEARLVSVPLLTQWLRDEGRAPEAVAIEEVHQPEYFWAGSTSVLAGEDVDMGERQILALLPSIAVRDLRRHSYPVTFYEHVRCAGVHEYQVGRNASPRPMTFRSVGISYVNELIGQDHVKRHIHFHASWLHAFVGSLVETGRRESADDSAVELVGRRLNRSSPARPDRSLRPPLLLPEPRPADEAFFKDAADCALVSRSSVPRRPPLSVEVGMGPGRGSADASATERRIRAEVGQSASRQHPQGGDRRREDGRQPIDLSGTPLRPTGWDSQVVFPPLTGP